MSTVVCKPAAECGARTTTALPSLEIGVRRAPCTLKSCGYVGNMVHMSIWVSGRTCRKSGMSTLVCKLATEWSTAATTTHCPHNSGVCRPPGTLKLGGYVGNVV